MAMMRGSANCRRKGKKSQLGIRVCEENPGQVEQKQLKLQPNKNKNKHKLGEKKKTKQVPCVPEEMETGHSTKK